MVICGAGIIGAASAYYLTQKGANVVLLEQDFPAAAASGKGAGRFLCLSMSTFRISISPSLVDASE